MMETDTFTLTDIPDAYLSNLARRYLPPADLVSLCDSHPNFEFLKLYLPEYLELRGENFKKWGPSDGHFCPEPYFLSPVMNQRVRSVIMSFRWRDQGYGNRKGMLWIELLRDSEVIGKGILLPWRTRMWRKHTSRWSRGRSVSSSHRSEVSHYYA